MIVIRARGATDVQALKRIADELGAEDVSVLPKRRSHGPSVSLLPGATIAPATRAAIMELVPVESGFAGDYETG